VCKLRKAEKKQDVMQNDNLSNAGALRV